MHVLHRLKARKLTKDTSEVGDGQPGSPYPVAGSNPEYEKPLCKERKFTRRLRFAMLYPVFFSIVAEKSPDIRGIEAFTSHNQSK